MDINKISVDQAIFDFMDNKDLDGVRHIKALPYLSIVQPLSGSYLLTLGNNDSIRIKSGDFFIAPSKVRQDIVHSTGGSRSGFSARWLFLDATVNDSYRLDDIYGFPVTVSGSEGAALSKLFEELSEVGGYCERMSIYYGIIGLLLRISSPKAVYGDDKIPLLIRYIEKHFDEDITADSLAALVYMSKSGVFYHFKKATGKSPIAYLNEYRLTIASDLLLNTTRSVTDISSSVGIRDPLYFSRLFKNKYRLSPREYRSRTSVSD